MEDAAVSAAAPAAAVALAAITIADDGMMFALQLLHNDGFGVDSKIWIERISARESWWGTF